MKINQLDFMQEVAKEHNKQIKLWEDLEGAGGEGGGRGDRDGEDM